MTREDLFRAVGEIREDQIEEAETVSRKRGRPWRRAGALAACLALAVTLAGAAPWIKEQPRWKSIIYSFNPGVVETAGGGGDAGGEAAAGGLDGSYYWTDGPDRPARPDYSTGVEIGQVSGPEAGRGEGAMSLESDTAWLTPEEIFAQDTVIFRGTVRELQFYRVDGMMGSIEVYYTRALVEVTDPIRGSLTAGETYSVLWLGAKGLMTTSLIGPLEDLDAGDEAVFMPVRADRDTGWREGDRYFCYADLGELYLGEGTRYVFAGTAEGLAFDRDAYPDLAEAETLDDVTAYIREQIGEGDTSWRVIIGAEEDPETGGYVFVEGTEQTQPASEPAVPQTEPSKGPSETADAGPSAPGPAGARELPKELPGGALIGEE